MQDLLEVIGEARAQDLDSRITLLEHDFLQAQPTKGGEDCG